MVRKIHLDDHRCTGAQHVLRGLNISPFVNHCHEFIETNKLGSRQTVEPVHRRLEPLPQCVLDTRPEHGLKTVAWIAILIGCCMSKRTSSDVCDHGFDPVRGKKTPYFEMAGNNSNSNQRHRLFFRCNITKSTC
ncbi:Uncharacterized protein HZ326_8204 [Fusarium oxysporum f. sp. albedinis]|nr:Uncharacterized protein HZ326_8204 [Fusarium oxysporum f. sp. albedinis]